MMRLGPDLPSPPRFRIQWGSLTMTYTAAVLEIIVLLLSYIGFSNIFNVGMIFSFWHHKYFNLGCSNYIISYPKIAMGN